MNKAEQILIIWIILLLITTSIFAGLFVTSETRYKKRLNQIIDLYEDNQDKLRKDCICTETQQFNITQILNSNNITFNDL